MNKEDNDLQTFRYPNNITEQNQWPNPLFIRNTSTDYGLSSDTTKRSCKDYKLEFFVDYAQEGSNGHKWWTSPPVKFYYDRILGFANTAGNPVDSLSM